MRRHEVHVTAVAALLAAILAWVPHALSMLGRALRGLAAKGEPGPVRGGRRPRPLSGRRPGSGPSRGLQTSPTGTTAAAVPPRTDPGSPAFGRGLNSSGPIGKCNCRRWGDDLDAASHLPEEEEKTYRALTDRSSPGFVADQPGYFGFFTYSLFVGDCPR